MGSWPASPQGAPLRRTAEDSLHGSRGDDPFDKLDAVALGLQIGRIAEIGVVDVEWRHRVSEVSRTQPWDRANCRLAVIRGTTPNDSSKFCPM